MNQAKLISVTPDAEQHIAYCARVSNPNNQDNENFAGLLKYCIKHQHWSIFEQAFMTLEMETTRGLAAQVLRHRSFSFQEFSQRYANVQDLGFRLDVPHLRRQDLKNRQASHDDLSSKDVETFYRRISQHYAEAEDLYQEMVSAGVAKECAREVLPLSTPTRLYMNGTIRSWIHYIQLRTEAGTQLEHRKIAEAVKTTFCQQLPVIARALEWTK